MKFDKIISDNIETFNYFNMKISALTSDKPY